jgi:hypothetical protein
MSLNMKLTRFLERLPEESAVFKLLIGDSRKQETQAIFVIEPHQPKMRSGDIAPELIAWDDAQEALLNEAENLGWGTDHTHIRINVKAADMTHLKSLTLSRRCEDFDPYLSSSDQSQSIMHLTNGLLAMTREVKQTLAIVTDSLAHREAVMGEMMQEMLEAKRDVAEAEGNAMALDIAMQAEDINNKNEFSQEALQQLGEIAKVIMGGQQKKDITVEEATSIIKDWMTNKPEIIQGVVNNPEIQGELVSAFMAHQSPPSPE